MANGSTWMNALIGAAVAVVLAFLPFSPLLGGGIAGYLERGDVREGAIVGGLAGLLATLPVAVLLTLLASFFAIVPMGMGVGGRVGFVGIIFLVATLVVALYTIGLGVLGGAIGSYVATETDIGGRPAT